VFHGATWNNKHTHIAFIASTSAYRKPIGFNRFPDGGRSKFIMEDVSIYLFKPDNITIQAIIDFNDLAGLLGTYRSNWKTSLIYTDTILYYHILPLMEWSWYKQLEEKRTSNKIEQDSSNRIHTLEILEKKYSKYYAFNIYLNKVNEVDSLFFHNLYNSSPNTNKANLTLLNKELLKVPLSEFGLVVQDIYPKTEKQYIKETIYLENECQLTRRAVAEQIISKLDPNQIHILIQKMDAYKNDLEGLEKTEYEIYSEETYNLIKELLESR